MDDQKRHSEETPERRQHEERRRKAILIGSGRLEGGQYETVKIAGSCRVDGDLDVNQMKIGGSARVDGNIKALELKTAGSCRVNGDVSAELMKTAGSCIVDGHVRAKLFKNAGSQEVNGTLRAEEITSGGTLKVSGDVEANKFLSRGQFEIGGLLTADEVKIELGQGRVQEIGGERIEIRSQGQFWGWRKLGTINIDFDDEDRPKAPPPPPPPEPPRKRKGFSYEHDEGGRHIKIDLGGLLEDVFQELERVGIDLGKMGGRSGHAFVGQMAGSVEADTIEGDEIFLENTRARIVRGKKITIGEGCEIETVEYTESLDISPSAQVKQQVKSGK
jgi:cytoskeletal protein CcmA (bactofilin family)